MRSVEGVVRVYRYGNKLKTIKYMRVITNGVVPIPGIGHTSKWGQVKPLSHPNHEIDLQFHFNLDSVKQDELERLIESNRVISYEEMVSKYSPNQEDLDVLITWLHKNGFYDIVKSADMCNVYASATADTISKTFNVNMIEIHGPDGSWVGSQDAPTIPVSVSNNLHTINGLQPFRQANKHSSTMNLTNRKFTQTQPARQTVSYAPPYTPSEILSAYNGSGLTALGSTQTIGILIDVLPKTTDLTSFWNYCGISNSLSRISLINVRNVRMPAPSGEESLDTEWTSSIAPNANIRVYAAGDLSFVHLDQALDRMITDVGSISGFRQISISLGLGELEMPTGEITTQTAKYVRLRALGVNIFVSSGDSGSNPDSILQVEYAASDSNVISVGGSSLHLNVTNGSVTTEVAWTGSGGGVSTKFSKPTWQPTGVGRMVPDVSATADPVYGALVVLNGRSYQFGGTSLSAPIWAGICALINDARVKSGRSTLGFLPPLIYPLVNTSRFRDITSGSNGVYSCSTGYDKVTGLGTPNIKNLISALNV